MSACLFIMCFNQFALAAFQLHSSSAPHHTRLCSSALSLRAATEIRKVWLASWMSAVPANLTWHCPLKKPLHSSTTEVCHMFWLVLTGHLSHIWKCRRVTADCALCVCHYLCWTRHSSNSWCLPYMRNTEWQADTKGLTCHNKTIPGQCHICRWYAVIFPREGREYK